MSAAGRRGGGWPTRPLWTSRKSRRCTSLIREDVQRVNRALPPAARARKFVLLHKEFDADEGELTRTRKLRRGLLGERYGDMIAAMYGGDERVQVQAAVKYRDGREGVIQTTVHIATLHDETDGMMEGTTS